jgi:hypothetical protein
MIASICTSADAPGRSKDLLSWVTCPMLTVELVVLVICAGRYYFLRNPDDPAVPSS